MKTLYFIEIVFLAFVLNEVQGSRKRPNIILIVADDVGYGNFFHTGHPTQERNEIDDMAENGMRFTHYVATGVYCTPNRAAMLSGRYPVRYGLYGKTLVFDLASPGGFPRSEYTIAEALRDAGYSTGMVGKWHLGLNEFNNTDGNFLPRNHGFDFVGLNIPFSHSPTCRPHGVSVDVKKNNCVLYNGSQIIEQPYNVKNLSTRMLEDAKYFIRAKANQENPFFFFMTHPQPHSTGYCGERFCGKSKRGILGDTLNEMAWMTGEIINEVKRNSIEEKTLIMFVNDHGPGNWRCEEEYSTGPFYGAGGTNWEGGLRGIALAMWPGKIHRGTVSHSIITPLDFFPTFTKLAGIRKNKEGVKYDGKEIQEIVLSKRKFEERQTNKDIDNNRFVVHYCNSIVFAARYNEYKMHYRTLDLPGIPRTTIPTENKFCNFQDLDWVTDRLSCTGSTMKIWDPPLLYNVDKDPAESLPLNLTEYADVVAKIKTLVEEHKKTVDFTKPGLLDLPRSNDLIPCCNPPDCICNHNEA